MNLLLELSLHGSLAFLLVWLLDRGSAGFMSMRARRWWWFLVPVAFLFSLHLPILPSYPAVSGGPTTAVWTLATRAGLAGQSAIGEMGGSAHFWAALWMAGALVYLLPIVFQTRNALRLWSGQRLSTDSALLDILEDCKQEAGVTAPIGLVVSDRISNLAILGWLRPRILVPQGLIGSLSRSQLRAVLFHELAHFRFRDIPLNWLYTLAGAIHWFNPLAYLAFRSWARFREEAADEAAMAWAGDSSGSVYGPALLQAIRQTHGAGTPSGALAIGESFHNLTRRLVMIHHHQNKSPRFLMAGIVCALIFAGFIVRPVEADDASDAKTAAVAAMQAWLQGIDSGQYAQSWKDACAAFQGAVTADQWTAALNAARSPLGKCTDRTVVSALHQTSVPSPTGTQKGDFYVVQFDSSFENLKYAVETVCFQKAPDGTWKAAGYYVKPKT